jgi:glycerophosphoryl diester phosphodiesterase
MPQHFAVRIGCLLMFSWASCAFADQPSARIDPQIVAHRGSSADRPENTLASARRAIEAGANAVEVDVRTTKDGVLVLSHDATVDRMTEGRGKVNDKTLAEIQQLDAGREFNPKFAGERVPTLEELLTHCRDKIEVQLDLKESGEPYERMVAETVRAAGDSRHIILGVRSIGQAKRFRKLLPDARQLGLIEKPGEIEAYAAAGVEMIRLWPKWLTDKSLVGRVRQAKVKLQLIETTGGQDEVARLLKYRPDSLSSDDPARLIATLAALVRP